MATFDDPFCAMHRNLQPCWECMRAQQKKDPKEVEIKLTIERQAGYDKEVMDAIEGILDLYPNCNAQAILTYLSIIHKE